MYYTLGIWEWSLRSEGMPPLKLKRSFDPYGWISFLTNSFGFDRDIIGQERKMSKWGFIRAFQGLRMEFLDNFFYKKNREDRNGVLE